MLRAAGSGQLCQPLQPADLDPTSCWAWLNIKPNRGGNSSIGPLYRKRCSGRTMHHEHVRRCETYHRPHIQSRFSCLRPRFPLQDANSSCKPKGLHVEYTHTSLSDALPTPSFRFCHLKFRIDWSSPKTLGSLWRRCHTVVKTGRTHMMQPQGPALTSSERPETSSQTDDTNHRHVESPVLTTCWHTGARRSSEAAILERSARGHYKPVRDTSAG